MGDKGPTLVGPSGPDGPIGQAGVVGTNGPTGNRGPLTAGLVGPQGPTGKAGLTGPTGAKGSTGLVGSVPCWVSYREFWFSSNSATLNEAGLKTIAGVAGYIKQNPSLQLGIDGFMDSNNMDLSNRRVSAVYDALIQNGVAADHIKIGALGDSKLYQNGRVELLITSIH
jgi:hypothetical protein